MNIRENTIKFGNLLADDPIFKNVGEDIQILAIENIYIKMGIDLSEIVRIPVSKLRTYDGDFVVLPINYPLYGKFNLSYKIIPVYLGLSLLSGEASEGLHLKQYEPIGCRDVHTYKELLERGIDAYLSGCLSLTLPYQFPNYKERDKVYIVDIPDKYKDILPDCIKKDAVYETHVFHGGSVSENYSRELYSKYINEARLIITSRLHCALPCLAAGLPVIFLCEKRSFRLDWLEKLIPIYTFDECDNIEWCPKPIEFENEKKIIQEYAIERIWKAYNENKMKVKISKLYLNENSKEYIFENLENVKKYIRMNWNLQDKKYEYILWGITQTTDQIYDYISEFYANASLRGVVDLYHPQHFRGIKTCGCEVLNNFSGVVFVTAESANSVVKDIVRNYDGIDCVLCWERNN